MRLVVSFLLVLFGVNSASAQLIEYHDLSEKLKEISGLEIIGDSMLVAFNDGGNDPKLYVLNFDGKIKRKVDVINAKNKDWEDIASDGTYLYIGDIGNNRNKRSTLKIYKIKIADIFASKEVKAKEITFNYGEQQSFPPGKDSLFYDAEGMTYYNDSLWIFTKDRSEPSEGYSFIYKIPTKPGTYTVYASQKVFTGKNGWWKDGITAVDVYENTFYLLTYNRYIRLNYEKGRFKNRKVFEFNQLSQRESIAVLNKQGIFVADEQNPLAGDVKLYKIIP